MYSSTSFFETRPPSPVPSICEISTPFSTASFRTAGVALTSERSGRSAVAVDEEADADADGDEDDIEEDADGCRGGADAGIADELTDGADAEEGGRGCDIEAAEDEGAGAAASFA